MDLLKHLHLHTLMIHCCLAWALHLFASTDQGGSLLDTFLTVLHQFIHVCSVVLWSMVSGAVKGVTDLHLFHLPYLGKRVF